MIHLTSHDLSPKEIIQTVFSPLIGSITSSGSDEICLKNNLSFVEILQPFSRLLSDAYFRDVSGTCVSVKGLRLNICDIGWRPPQPNLARKILNESVTSAQCYKTKIININAEIQLEIPLSELWFEQWREAFFTVQFPADHEYTRHLLACLVVVASTEVNPVEVANTLTKKIHMMQNVMPPKLPKWFSNDILMCYVMIHDAMTGDITNSQLAFESLKSTFGDMKCFLLQVNSSTDPHRDNTELWSKYLKRYKRNIATSEYDASVKISHENLNSFTSADVPDVRLESPSFGIVAGTEAIQHPLSPVQEQTDIGMMDPMLSISSDSLTTIHSTTSTWGGESNPNCSYGHFLSAGDFENIKHFVQDFTIRSLIPYVEKMICHLNDTITNKKGVSRSLLSATKRWFVTNKPGVNTTQNAVVYTNESTELQIRKLGDLYFMFGNYGLAFQAYHTAKRDFNADSAWQYYAGALEMAALAAFMLDTANKKTYDYMEEAIVTYLNSCKLPQFATRATILSVECLKYAKMYGEAAKQLIRMTSEDSDLRSALLLEQASYCFLYSEPPLYRKYSFQSVLAGHRFSKSGQRKHAFRCYNQAYQIFKNREWSLAEDHIQYTIGKQAVTLKKLDEASSALAHLLRPSSLQDVKQQHAFLREYIATQKAIHQNDDSTILNIALPSVVQNLTRILVTSQPPVANPNMIPAKNINIYSSLDDTSKWDRLEEMIVNFSAKKPVMMFKPTRALFTNKSVNLGNPLAIQGEHIEIALTLENTIKPQILFEDIHLLWTFKKDDDTIIENKSLFQLHVRQDNIEFFESIVSSTSIEAVQLSGQEHKNIVIKLTPKLAGTLEITGLIGRISALNDALSLLGKITFKKIPIKQPSKDVANHDATEKAQNYDKLFEIMVLPPASALHVNFSATPNDVLAGEIIPVEIFLTNTGADTLNDIYVAANEPRWILINPEENEMPLSILKDYRDLTNETFSKEKETRRQHVFKLFSGGSQLKSKETKSTTIWLQAPYQKGQTDLSILIYYGMPQGYPKLTHRLIRHTWNFNIIESVEIEGHCNIANARTNELGIGLNVKNISQVQNVTNTSIILTNFAMYCSTYAVNLNKDVLYMNGPDFGQACEKNREMKPNDSVYMRIPLKQKQPNLNQLSPIEFVQSRLSEFPIQSIESAKNSVPSFKNLGNFFIKYETTFVRQTAQSEEFNNIISIPDKHLTMAVTWQGMIYENGVFIRSTFGQSFIQLRYFYETVSSLHASPSFYGHDQMTSIFEAKNNFNFGNSLDGDDDWAVHNVSVTKRCLLDDETFRCFDDVDLKTC